MGLIKNRPQPPPANGPSISVCVDTDRGERIWKQGPLDLLHQSFKMREQNEGTTQGPLCETLLGQKIEGWI